MNLFPWWRYEMETFSALLALCAGNLPVTGEFPAQRPVTRSFDVFFDMRLNKRLSKQSWGWWFETPSRPLWRHCNVCNTEVCIVYDSREHRSHSNIRVDSECFYHAPVIMPNCLNPLRPSPNRRLLTDDIFKCIFLNGNVWISIKKKSTEVFPKGPINNIPGLVQIMAWRQPGDKTFSEPMLVILLTHRCATRPQWVTSLSWIVPGTIRVKISVT